MATDVTTKPGRAGGPKVEEAALPAEPAVRPIRLSDLGGALTACEATLREGWSACITRELEARGYRVEAEAGELKAAGPEVAAVSGEIEAVPPGEAAAAGEPAVR